MYARTSSIPPIQVLSDQLRLLLRSSRSPSLTSAMVVDVLPGGFVPRRAPAHIIGNEERERSMTAATRITHRPRVNSRANQTKSLRDCAVQGPFHTAQAKEMGVPQGHRFVSRRINPPA